MQNTDTAPQTVVVTIKPKMNNSSMEISDRLIGCIFDDQGAITNAPKESAAVSPKVLAITGRLHSSFLSSPVAPSKLVNAGWESSSETSPEPLVAVA